MWLMKIYVVSVVAPVIANQAGWVAAEVGRQPWVVYGLLRTSDALSKTVKAEQVLGSIVMFTLIYALLGIVWLFVVNKKIKEGPEESSHVPPLTTAGGLLSAASGTADPSGPSMTDAKEDF
jgi:cytochrome d ubiquinol oxidase subunit I